MKNTQPLFVLFLLLSSIPLEAQFHLVGSPEIINFSKSDYHAGTQNWSITQDWNGIMYFGNNKGLLEFDGTHWRNYRLPNQTIIRSLAIGPKGEVLIGAQDEFGYFAPDKTGVLHYRSLVDSVPQNFRSFEDVWKIFRVGKAAVFCSQRVIFIWENGQLQVIPPVSRFENFFEVNGEIFVVDNEAGLLKWNIGQFELVSGGTQFIDSRIATILPSGQKELIVSKSQGLFLMDDTGIQIWDTDASSFLKENSPYCGIQLSDGNYAIGTAQDGLLLLSRNGEPLMHLNKETGLQNNTVLAVFQDHQQNLWLGLDNGIDYAKVSAPFMRISSAAGVEGTGYVSNIYEDQLYLGTNQGLFYLNWTEDRTPIKPPRFVAAEGPKGQVWSLDKVDGQLVAGMHEGAYLLKKGRMEPISSRQGAWKFMELKGHPGYAIEGTYNGLSIYQENEVEGGANWKFKNNLKGFDESARVMEQDENGHIWVSHAYKGLYRIKLSEDLGAVEEVRFFTEEDGLPSNISINVTAVKGEMVFTTLEGVFFYDPKTDHFFPHERFNEILGGARNIHRIIEDRSGNIWYSIEDEFGVLQIKENGFLKDVQVDRLAFNQIQEELVDGFEHIYAHDEHNVFIATEKGFIHYNPAAGNRQNLLPLAKIREVVSIAGKDSIIYGGNWVDSTYFQKPVELPFSMRSVRFSYSTPFFEHIGQVEYRHKLEGFMEEWSEWSGQTVKEFTNLPQGEYTFWLEAKNGYGQVSKPAYFKVTINPPWYASGFAKTIYFLLAAILTGGVYRYYTAKLEKEKVTVFLEQNKKLEKKEAMFKVEQEQSEAEIVRLRNENLQSDIKHKNSQLAAATMHLVQKGEIMLKIKNELNKLPSDTNRGNQKKIQQLVRMIDEDIRLDNNWDQFEVHFDQVHENFLKNLRDAYPNLTPKDQKLCAYLRMNLATKEIAPLMNISVRGVEISRYRLRKKMGLSSDINLVDFIMKF